MTDHTSTRRARGRQRRLRRRAPRRGARQVGRPRSRRTRWAARACTAAASRRRRCCTPPRSPRTCAMPRPSASARTLEGIDPAGVRAYREGIVAKKFKGLEGLVKARGITVVAGRGPTRGRAAPCGSATTSTAAPTSSWRPARTAARLPGLEIGGRILTSEHALELDEIPGSVVILGGGVIGVEFASVWRSFGAEVTIIEALDHLVPNEDVALSKGLERAFRAAASPTPSVCGSRARRRRTNGVTVTLEDGKTFDGRLPARRRRSRPGDGGLGYEEAGVTLDRGFVVADERLRTGVDARVGRRRHRPGPPARAPRLPAGHLRRGADRRAEPRASSRTSQIPKVTYSSPEVASVGLTEAQAVDAHGADGVVVVRVQPRRQRQERDPRHRRASSRSCA